MCKRRVISHHVPGISKEVGPWEELGDEQRQVCVSSLLPLESVQMVRALGGLLKFIDQRRLGVELEDRAVQVPILALKHFTLSVTQNLEIKYFNAQICEIS